MDVNLTIRLPAVVKETLDKLAEATGRSRSFLAQEALRRYLDEEGWQVREIREAIREADAGDFATDEGVASTLATWGVSAR
jgi:predicted transcriptional regulator